MLHLHFTVATDNTLFGDFRKKSPIRKKNPIRQKTLHTCKIARIDL